MSLEELYQEIILDHYRSPRGRGRLPRPTARVHHHNPLCGDEILLDVEVSDGKVVGIAFEGQGCSISQASASMMTEAVRGKTVEEAADLAEEVRLVMHGKPADEERLGEVAALEGVRRFPVRVKCALLAWMALLDALGVKPGEKP